MPYKISQVDDNNKSWNNTDQKVLNFVEKNKGSNVLDQIYLTTDKKSSRSNEKYKKKSENLSIKLTPLLIESNVKRLSTTP